MVPLFHLGACNPLPNLSQYENWGPALGKSLELGTNLRARGKRVLGSPWSVSRWQLLVPGAEEPPFHSGSGLTSQWHCPTQANHSPGPGPTGILQYLAYFLSKGADEG